MKKPIKIFPLTVLISTSFLYTQPDPRFDPFDWVTYRQTGAIRSVTEGFSYIYFGTDDGGILRYHSYGNGFDEPITRAQGLSSNHIQAIHFDRETGTLWVATDKTLEYSYSREGEWTSINFGDIGLSKGARIKQIGSSSDYLWVHASSALLKLDRISGILTGILSNPDEEEISWSSGRWLMGTELPESVADFSVAEGWVLNLSQFVDPYGRRVRITTVFQTQFSDIWVGTEDGTLFFGDVQMETFYPMNFGLANTDVTAMTHGNHLWIVGRLGSGAEGLTRFDPDRLLFDLHDFNVNINMNPQSFYTLIDVGEEIWFGGKLGILVYNKNDTFWRLIDEARGLPRGPIITMTQDTGFVWIGTPRGIARIHKSSKRARRTGIEDFLYEDFIYDMETIEDQVWISTEYQLYIYDQKQESLYDFREMGDLSKISDKKDLFTDFWEIEYYMNKVFIATAQGLLVYDRNRYIWYLAFETSEYQGQKINTMTFSGKTCFLGTNFGFISIDLTDYFKRDYTYTFIGQVNDMFITDRILWLGTNKGLTRFLWRKDN